MGWLCLWREICDPLPDCGFDLIKEGRVRLTCKYNVSQTVGDYIIWVCGNVIE